MPQSDLAPASAIERGFPVRQVNDLAAREAYNKHHYRPTNYQHKWWARRLGSVFRTLCIASLADADIPPEAVWDRYAESNDVGDAVVFDPFMGGGTTGQEATRLGASFVGADVNPVAWFVARMALAPQPDALDDAFESVLAAARREVGAFYRTTCPDCGEACGAQFYLWVRLVDEGGATRREYDSLVVDHDGDGGATVVCPDCHGLSGVDDPATATCDACDAGFDATAADVRATRSEPTAVFGGGERPAYEPYAVKVDCGDCGTGFAAFDGSDAERLAAARERFAARRDALPLPETDIPRGGEKTGALQDRGYRRWTDLFNARQLLALGTLVAEVRAVEDDLARQYLALTLSATLEFSSMFCSYKGSDPRGPGAVRHVFSHHAFVHPAEPLENNPLGTRPRQSGTFRYLHEYRGRRARSFQREPVERVPTGDGGTTKQPVPGETIGGRPASSVGDLLETDATHYLHCGDSGDLPSADRLAGAVDAVVTDPPYFDSVQYAELADFFYAWLRRAVGETVSGTFAADTVLSAAEAVGNASREKSLADYRRLLARAFGTAAEVLAEDGPLVFTFHHREPAVWGAVLEALRAAGFRVVATYPVRGENRLSVHINGQRAIQLDSVVVCRTGHREPPASWRTVREEVRTAAAERLRSFRDADGDLSALDASVVVRGACMTAFSAREAVHADGEALAAGDAMRRVDEVAAALNEREF